MLYQLQEYQYIWKSLCRYLAASGPELRLTVPLILCSHPDSRFISFEKHRPKLE